MMLDMWLSGFMTAISIWSLSEGDKSFFISVPLAILLSLWGLGVLDK